MSKNSPVKYKIACAIIVNNKDEILLTKRAREPFKGKWALISGIGESKKGIPPEKGVVEEVTCDIGTKSFTTTSKFSIPVRGDKETDEVVVFVGTIKEDEIEIQPKFSSGIKWVPKNEIKKLHNLAFEHDQVIQKYLEHKSS
jgi:ADP-ribose pyrophosphatase YjhB (NUDIX family)